MKCACAFSYRCAAVRLASSWPRACCKTKRGCSRYRLSEEGTKPPLPQPLVSLLFFFSQPLSPDFVARPVTRSGASRRVQHPTTKRAGSSTAAIAATGTASADAFGCGGAAEAATCLERLGGRPILPPLAAGTRSRSPGDAPHAAIRARGRPGADAEARWSAGTGPAAAAANRLLPAPCAAGVPTSRPAAAATQRAVGGQPDIQGTELERSAGPCTRAFEARQVEKYEHSETLEFEIPQVQNQKPKPEGDPAGHAGQRGPFTVSDPAPFSTKFRSSAPPVVAMSCSKHACIACTGSAVVPKRKHR